MVFEINERNQTVLKDLLDENIASARSDPNNSKKLGTLYKACMDEPTIEKTSVADLTSAAGKPIGDKMKTGGSGQRAGSAARRDWQTDVRFSAVARL